MHLHASWDFDSAGEALVQIGLGLWVSEQYALAVCICGSDFSRTVIYLAVNETSRTLGDAGEALGWLRESCEIDQTWAEGRGRGTNICFFLRLHLPPRSWPDDFHSLTKAIQEPSPESHNLLEVIERSP